MKLTQKIPEFWEVGYHWQKEGPHQGAGLDEAPIPIYSGGLNDRNYLID